MMTERTEYGPERVHPRSEAMTLTIVVKEVVEENLASYFVAQCVELPGCVAEGDTEEEARTAMQSAMSSCLSVLFEDSIRQLTGRTPPPDLRGVSSQFGLEIDFTPHMHLV